MKLKYKIKKANGKIRAYVDRRFCYCAADVGPHIHEKRKGGK